MVSVESVIKTTDNSGANSMKIIRISGGLRRRYARLSEMVGAVGHSLKRYAMSEDPKAQLRIAKKVKKKRKVKAKSKKRPNQRPYLIMLTCLKKASKRQDGGYIKFDANQCAVFTEPTKFGPAGKTENIPNLVGTKFRAPATLELFCNKTIKDRFKTFREAVGYVV
jgi:ribosomal protein L14